jgi:hypothetical protein
VTGESTKNELIQANDDGAFYDKIHTADNSLIVINENTWQQTAFNIFIFLVLATSAYLVIKK